MSIGNRLFGYETAPGCLKNLLLQLIARAAPGLLPKIRAQGYITQISSINPNSNTITLASPLARSSGQPVWLYKDSTGRTVLFRHSARLGHASGALLSSPGSSDRTYADGTVRTAAVLLRRREGLTN
jgi:hypothetical protein